MGSIPHQGTKIPHATQCNQKTKQNWDCNPIASPEELLISHWPKQVSWLNTALEVGNILFLLMGSCRVTWQSEGWRKEPLIHVVHHTVLTQDQGPVPTPRPLLPLKEACLLLLRDDHVRRDGAGPWCYDHKQEGEREPEAAYPTLLRATSCWSQKLTPALHERPMDQKAPVQQAIVSKRKEQIQPSVIYFWGNIWRSQDSPMNNHTSVPTVEKLSSFTSRDCSVWRSWVVL